MSSVARWGPVAYDASRGTAATAALARSTRCPSLGRSGTVMSRSSTWAGSTRPAAKTARTKLRSFSRPANVFATHRSSGCRHSPTRRPRGGRAAAPTLLAAVPSTAKPRRRRCRRSPRPTSTARTSRPAQRSARAPTRPHEPAPSPSARGSARVPSAPTAAEFRRQSTGRRTARTGAPCRRRRPHPPVRAVRRLAPPTARVPRRRRCSSRASTSRLPW